MTIRVLIVDDSALIREILSKTLVRDGDIEIVGAAEDAVTAREMIKTLNPDVVTLDIEMPNMNGLAFLDRLMRLRPTPVVMVSTLTKRGAGETLLALELGAVDFVAKPGPALRGDLETWGAMLRAKLRTAAASPVRNRAARADAPAKTLASAAGPDGALIAIGASTGGVEAVRAVLSALPKDCPPVVIAQHMPAGFTTRFAARLDELCAVSVTEVSEGMPISPGHAYVARGDWHFQLARRNGGLISRLTQDDTVSGHRPSVDVLFKSVAKVSGSLGVGVILTGMGGDGAVGLKAMREAGAFTIGQSESSSLVYGMPRVAFEQGAVCEQVALEGIAACIAAALGRLRKAA